MVDDDDSDESPSPEPRTDSRSALPRGFRAWRRFRIVKHDETFSLIFFSPNMNIWSWSLARGQGVGPLVFIFGEDFLLFFLRCSVEFQVIPRTFVSAHK